MNNTETFNLFVYGTLLGDSNFKHFAPEYTGHGQWTTLEGFERRAVSHGGFPAIFPNTGHNVRGMLFKDVPSRYLSRFDSYEGCHGGPGDLYNRHKVTVPDPVTGVDVETFVYVWPKGTEGLQANDWDVDYFLGRSNS